MTDRYIPLFYPHLPVEARDAAREVMDTRWIGQARKVDEFERKFKEKFNSYSPVAVNSGTSALHLAYVLAGIGEGDEVIVPALTCTATNIPLLYQRAKVIFADVKPGSLNIDPKHVKSLISERTKAIVCVDFGGMPCDYDRLQYLADRANAKLIADSAQSLGARYRNYNVGMLADFTAISFQAIKVLTTGDGGMLIVKDENLSQKAKRLRWFGIDRSAKEKGVWENDITEIGYKYQMTDIDASMGIAGLKLLNNHLAYRRKLYFAYKQGLEGVSGIKIVNGEEEDKESNHWMFSVLVENRKELEKKLREKGIECAQVHYRNDMYSIFGERAYLPNLDKIEDKYEILPLHGQMDEEDVKWICEVIKEGW